MNSVNIFFILYDARSGSTFLSNLLVKNYDIVIPPESNFIIKITKHYKKDTIINTDGNLKDIIDFIYKDDKFKDWRIDKETLYVSLYDELPLKINEVIYHILDMYRKNNNPFAKLIGVKKGSYLLFKKNIFDFFPESKIISIIRDGRAVYNSKKSNIVSSTNRPFASKPEQAALEWMYKADMIEEIKKEKKNDNIIIYYEDIVLNTKQSLKNIARFLNAEENQDNDTKMYVSKERYGKLHQNIQRESIFARINAWKNNLSKLEIRKYELYAYDHLNKYGYDCEIINDNNNRTIYRYIYLYKKLIFKLKNKAASILLPYISK